jgi:hypothetical protein
VGMATVGCHRHLPLASRRVNTIPFHKVGYCFARYAAPSILEFGGDARCSVALFALLEDAADLLDQGAAARAPDPDPRLIRTVIEGRIRAAGYLEPDRGLTVSDIARREGSDAGDVSRSLQLAFLAPDLLARILDGSRAVPSSEAVSTSAPPSKKAALGSGPIKSQR